MSSDGYRQFTVEIAIMGRAGEASGDLLKRSVEELYLRKAQKFSPDHRFDWSTARCDVTQIEQVRTPNTR
jgi:hypothetical protein